jgi:hypothetical protein
MQNKSVVIITFICLFTFVFTAEGQKLVNSPYSRFNMGTLNPVGPFRGLSMGGTGTGIRDNNSIYFMNPASYSSLDTNSFVFDFGMDYGINILSDNVSNYSSDDLNFNHLLIGFPLGYKWGFATGLIPVSNGYYNLSNSIKEGDRDYDPLTGAVTILHKGTGSFTNFFIGTGVNITKNISAGANFVVLFGQMQRKNQFDFKESNNLFGTISAENLEINGVNLDYGIQYTKNLKKNHFITAGISYTAAKKYNSSFNKITQRFTSYFSPPYSPDTLYYVNSSSKDSTRLPGTIRLGVSYGKKDKFLAAIDYVFSNWNDARIIGSNGYLANTKSLRFGMEFIPDKFSNYSFLNRIEYRLGGHISDDYLIINGSQIKEMGISCGLGLSMRRSLSKANLFFDFTRKTGSVTNNVLNENCYTIGISLNLYDFWFIKRKYD